MIDREERIDAIVLAVAESVQSWDFNKARGLLADLLREFGHVAGCECNSIGGETESTGHSTVMRFGKRDSRCFQQSPAKETR